MLHSSIFFGSPTMLVFLHKLILFASLVCMLAPLGRAAEPTIINLWPKKPPGETASLPAEADQTKASDALIAGRKIIKLGNVSIPQIAIHLAPKEKNSGTTVVVCPGGGHHILAYDLEGTEVADWLNSIGVNAVVLKYRVPYRDSADRSRAAVQDAQRAMSLVRSRAPEWGLDPDRIGICGFSAGGETAALTCVTPKRRYNAVDANDEVDFRPNFAMLIYPGGIIDKSQTEPELVKAIQVSDETPPMFFVHAFDDNVSIQHSLALASALKQVDVPVEVHVFAFGGHGYGLRETELPVTRWPALATDWLKQMKFLK